MGIEKTDKLVIKAWLKLIFERVANVYGRIWAEVGELESGKWNVWFLTLKVKFHQTFHPHQLKQQKILYNIS